MKPPVCVKCRLEMRPEKNGVKWVEMASFGPYKIWDSEKWKCRKCGIEVLSGFGQTALKEHFQDKFSDVLDTYRVEGELIEEAGK